MLLLGSLAALTCVPRTLLWEQDPLGALHGVPFFLEL